MGITSAITIDAWVYIQADSANNVRIECKPFDSNWVSPYADYELAVLGTGGWGVNRSIYFGLTLGGTWTYLTSGANQVPLQTWTQIAATYDGANMKIYIGDEQKATQPATGAIGASGNPLFIGCRTPTPNEVFNGKIDEVRISSTARTTFDLSSPFSPDGDTAALWHFDEGTGQVASDSSGNNVAGQLGSQNIADTNDPTWVDSKNLGPQWVTGQTTDFGSALSFDGIDDFVSVGDSNSLDISSKLTIEGWIVADVINTYKSMVVKGSAYSEGNLINYGLQIQAESGPGRLRLFIYDVAQGGYKWADSSGTVANDGQWHKIAVVVDTVANTASFYIDSTTADIKTFNYDLPVGNGSLDIGRQRHLTMGASQYFDGKMDELRIWSSVLAGSQLWDMLGPTVSNVVANPIVINTPPVVTADVTDGTGTGVKLVEYSVDAGDWLTVLPTFSVPGLHTIKVRGTDYALNVGSAVSTILAVYDPNDGFVTGGGWILSPAGAYATDPTLTGKATFGFVSKYVKGKTVPTGNTEFQFKAGDLNFKSTSYEWLVVAGPKAQFKGVGTINGAGNYGFMLTAIDGQINGDGGIDKFRIKIWEVATSAIVYDNKMGSSDIGNDATELGGGSIVIHK